jgi:hypothetical protein
MLKKKNSPEGCGIFTTANNTEGGDSRIFDGISGL